MIFSKREQIIGIVAAAALGILAIDQLVVAPYTERLDELQTARTAADQTLLQNQNLLDRRDKLKVIWNQMLAGGLSSDESKTRGQLEHALVDWTRTANLSVNSSKSNVATKNGDFETLNYDINAGGSTSGAARMIWALEQASIPMRINEIQLSSRPEGTDQLTARLSISTLCIAPGANIVPPTPKPATPSTRPAQNQGEES